MLKVTHIGVSKMCNKLIENNKESFNSCDFIIGVSRGGLVPATLIATKLDKPLIAAYIDKLDNVYIDRTDWILDKNVIIIDDIIRTGKTVNKILALVRQHQPSGISIFSLSRSPEVEQLGNSAILRRDTVKMPWDHNLQ